MHARSELTCAQLGVVVVEAFIVTRPIIYVTVVRPVRQQAFLLYSHNFHKYKIHNLSCFKQTFTIFNACIHSPFKLPKLILLLCVAIDSQWLMVLMESNSV